MDCELAEAIANSLDEYKAQIKRAIMRGIETLSPQRPDASDFIRIQAVAGIEPLYGSTQDTGSGQAEISTPG